MSLPLAMGQLRPRRRLGRRPGLLELCHVVQRHDAGRARFGLGNRFPTGRNEGIRRDRPVPAHHDRADRPDVQLLGQRRPDRPGRLPLLACPAIRPARLRVVRLHARQTIARRHALVFQAGPGPGRGPSAVGHVLARRRSGDHAKPVERSQSGLRRHPGRLEQGQPQPPGPGRLRARCARPTLGHGSRRRRLQPARLFRRKALRLLSPAGRGAQHAGDQSRRPARTRNPRAPRGSAARVSSRTGQWPWPI